MTFAISGASGRLGRLATAAFRRASPTARLRLLSRNPAALSSAPYTDCVAADLDEPVGMVKALDGVATFLLISTDGEATLRSKRHRAAIESAKRAGVAHIVYTSLIGARPDSPLSFARSHADTEAALQESGLRHTILRNAPYAEVLDTFIAATMGNNHFIMPAAHAPVAYVPRANAAVAAAGAMVRTTDGKSTYDITGSHALTANDIARLIEEIRGVLPVVIDADPWDYLQATHVPFGAPRFSLRAAEDGWHLSEGGEYAKVSNDIRDLAPSSLIELPDYVRAVIVPRASV